MRLSQFSFFNILFNMNISKRPYGNELNHQLQRNGPVNQKTINWIFLTDSSKCSPLKSQPFQSKRAVNVNVNQSALYVQLPTARDLLMNGIKV
jgi:hypothetical protein